MTDTELLGLVRTARHLYETNRKHEWVVEPGMPVLFFGDILGFEASYPRVVTVGLNPSRHEFPKHAPFKRFDGADSDDESSYLSALSAYFRSYPYKSWFNSYEQALQGMGTSYYDGKANTALHTDIGSVIPTDPTWRKLDTSIHRRLCRENVPLWHRLIECLQPDILLQSTAWKWLDLIQFAPLTPWEQVHKFELTKDGKQRKSPIEVKVRWHLLDSGNFVLLAHVPQTQTPLGKLSHNQKRQVGKIVKARWQRGI